LQAFARNKAADQQNMMQALKEAKTIADTFTVAKKYV
jgi:VCBS repeat-containing protein